jgi:hypothetical protein
MRKICSQDTRERGDTRLRRRSKTVGMEHDDF